MSKIIKKRDATRSKQLILKNAIEIFAKNGYEKSSMEELAYMCNLNKAMIFYYYTNKRGLYEAVIIKILDEIYDRITKDNQNYNSSSKKLQSFIETYSNFAVSHPYLPSLLLRELSNSDSHLGKTLFTNMKKLYTLFENIIHKGINDGCFKDNLPMVIYFMVIGTLNLMITTKPLRIEANTTDNIDTCSNCQMEEISKYINIKIQNILKD